MNARGIPHALRMGMVWVTWLGHPGQDLDRRSPPPDWDRTWTGGTLLPVKRQRCKTLPSLILRVQMAITNVARLGYKYGQPVTVIYHKLNAFIVASVA